MQRIHTFLDMVLEQGGSDLHLVAGNPPRIRLHGIAYEVKYRELTADDIYNLVFELIPEKLHNDFKEKGNADFSYDYGASGRFRVNVFQHLGGLGAVFRVIPTEVISLNKLGLPPVL